MTDEGRLEKAAVKAFRQHWAKIVRSIEKGKNTYADKRYDCFEADTSARQKILANRFYGLDHAKKMAALSEKAIKRKLSCYLSKAVGYAISDNEDEPKEQETFIKTLVSCEYVIFRSRQCAPFECYDEDADDIWVAEYPARVAYDDWYEGSIGAGQMCQTSILMKSTGEMFSKTEVEWLKGSIQHNIDGNDHSAFWWFECEPLTRNRIWIKIYDFEIDKGGYVEEFLRELGNLSRKQLHEFIRQTLERLKEEYQGEEIIDKLNVFNNYESMEEKGLFNITWDFFWTNWDAEILSDYDIRAAEDTMNRIWGRKDRDYHSGINF